jgi:hypothetical protein
MYNLISFSHYTAGGLLGDILNDTWSELGKNNGIRSRYHTIGKIRDTDTIVDNINQSEFDNMLDYFNLHKIDAHAWIGTHSWLGNIDLSNVGYVLNITTATERSKIYRWIRAYHLFFATQPEFKLDDIDLIDKLRELAKNYIKPFNLVVKPNVINIEFAEIVEQTQSFNDLVDRFDRLKNLNKHMDRWKNVNSFLYDQKLWNNDLVKRYYEADYELKYNSPYRYI